MIRSHLLRMKEQRKMHAVIASNGNTIKISISLDAEIYQTSKMIAGQLGFRHSYSAYLNELARKDAQCRLATIKLPSA